MSVIRAVDAPRFELPGVEFTALAAPSRGSADVCTWKLTVAPGRDPDQPHTVDQDEVFMVLSGSIRATPGGETLGAGDAIIVKAGDPIQLVNLGSDPAVLYVAIRSGFIGTMADGTKVTPPWAV